MLQVPKAATKEGTNISTEERHRRMKESDIYLPAIRWLCGQPKTKAWIHWNNAIYLPKPGIWKRKKGHEDGIPDILGVKNGRPFAFEVKRPGNKPTQAQINWMQRFTECGGIAYVVNTLEDIECAWSEI